MLSYQCTAAKRAAILLVVGVLSMAVYVWAAPPPGDGGAGKPGRACPGERFRQADTDGDGALSKDEAMHGMPRIAKNFQAIDANRDGQVSGDELHAFIRARRKALCEAST